MTEGTILDRAKARVAAVLRTGEVAVDATMGNGWDTLFLAKMVGACGHVHAFDVQAAALVATEKRLRKAGLGERCTLHLRGHEEMAAVVPPGVGAVMMNLGYLPYADRQIVTRSETTLAALVAAKNVMRPGGVLCVVCYRGHPGGPEEAEAVWQWTREVGDDFSVEAPQAWPSGEDPVLLSLQKREG